MSPIINFKMTKDLTDSLNKSWTALCIDTICFVPEISINNIFVVVPDLGHGDRDFSYSRLASWTRTDHGVIQVFFGPTWHWTLLWTPTQLLGMANAKSSDILKKKKKKLSAIYTYILITILYNRHALLISIQKTVSFYTEWYKK